MDGRRDVLFESTIPVLAEMNCVKQGKELRQDRWSPSQEQNSKFPI